MKIRNKILSPLIITLSSLVLLVSCGGGSGGDDAPSTNSCSVIGLNTKIAGLQAKDIQTKIIGGDSCTGTSSVVPITVVEGTSGSRCTATVISDKKIITAAHCVVRRLSSIPYQLPNNSVILGNQTSTKISVPSKFFDDLDRLNSRYGNFQSANDEAKTNEVLNDIFKDGLADVAVVEFRDSLNLPIIKIETTNQINIDQVISIFGYGLTDANNDKSFSNEVRGGEMSIDILGPSNFGAVFRKDGSNTCFGDSGGPVFVGNGEAGIVGITSLGTNSCKVGELSIFTNLATPEVQALLR